jgi:hypothetical protein
VIFQRVIFAAALLFAAPAFAQKDQPTTPEAPAEAAPETVAPATNTLLPESVNLEVVAGSTVPDDCMYPESLTDAARFELGCATMPRFGSSAVAARYIGQLGELGWRQGAYVSGGMTAVRTDENECEHVLNIFVSSYPPGNENAALAVMWLAMDRTPRCPTPSETP